MANLNNTNATVNFGFAGNSQAGTVVVRSRQSKMRLHTGKPLSQPHYLASTSISSQLAISSRDLSERSEEADHRSAAACRACWPAAELPPAAWASLVISRAISL